MSADDSPTSTREDSSPTTVDSGDSVSDPGEVITPGELITPDIKVEQSFDTKNLQNDGLRHHCSADEEFGVRDSNGSFILEQSKSSRRKLRLKKDSLPGQASKWYEGSVQHDESDAMLTDSSRLMNGAHRPLRERVMKINTRASNPKFSEKYHSLSNRLRDRYDSQSCSCSQNGDYRPKDGYHMSTVRSVREIKTAHKPEPALDVPRPLYRGNKYINGCFIPENCVLPKGKLSSSSPGRDVIHTRQVWEPTDARRKGTRSNSGLEVNSRTVVVANQSVGMQDKTDNECSSEFPGNLCKADGLSNDFEGCEDVRKTSTTGFVTLTKSDCYSKDGALSPFSLAISCGDPTVSSSSSDNCSSCLNEGDISTSSSGKNGESSSTSDSEDSSPQSEGRDDNPLNKCRINGEGSFMRTSAEFEVVDCVSANFPMDEPRKAVQISDNGGFRFDTPPPQQHILPMQSQSIHMPVFSPPAVGYHNQSTVSWQASPNGLMQFPQPNHFVFPPNPLGYSLPPPRSSEFGIHYNPLQAITTPVFNARHHPLYQPNNRVYVANPKEQIKNFSVAEPVSCVSPLERQFPERRMPSKAPSNGQILSAGNPSRPSDCGSSFSLFHFGGPTAAAKGFNAAASLNEESTGRLTAISAAAEADVTCSKEDATIEEYSLFSTGNGARFSIF